MTKSCYFVDPNKKPAAPETDEDRVNAEFKKVFHTIDHPMLAQLLERLPTRGLVAVLQDIAEVARNRNSENTLGTPHVQTEIISM